MGITVQYVCVQQMAYAYAREFILTFVTTLQTVVDYVAKKWHSIHEQWVIGMKFSTGNFLNSNQ